MYAVEAMNGPLDGKRWPFESEITIGRDDSEAHAALPTDRAVSRRHAKLSVVEGELVLVDLRSRNGTVLEGNRIDCETHLSAGQAFTVGRTLLRVVEINDDQPLEIPETQ